MRLRMTLLPLVLFTTRVLSTGGGPGGPEPGPGSAGVGLPAVDHATDLDTAPVVHPGPGEPETILLTRDLVIGTGEEAVASSTVHIQYLGALYRTGAIFDATWTRGGRPTSFPLSRVVPGFAQGIVGMKIGGRRQIVIPPELGYGTQNNGPIPGNSTLVFIVDLLGV